MSVSQTARLRPRALGFMSVLLCPTRVFKVRGLGFRVRGFWAFEGFGIGVSVLRVSASGFARRVMVRLLGQCFRV